MARHLRGYLTEPLRLATNACSLYSGILVISCLRIREIDTGDELMASKQPTPGPEAKAKAAKRSRLSQEEVPAYSLEQAIRVPRAIADNYAYKPTRPLNVAGAMKGIS
jgi:hypothetical protein